MLQRTPEWYAIRVGKVTASRIADVMTAKADAITRSNYLAEKVLERESGEPEDDNYVSAAMQAGIDNEEPARLAYAFATGRDVVEIDFVDHPKIAQAGCSPDGLVGDDGLVEIKCLNARGSLDARLGKEPLRRYVLQCQFQMACTGRKWVDLCVYRKGRLAITRIARNDEQISKIEAEVVKFLAEVEDEYRKLCEAE